MTLPIERLIVDFDIADVITTPSGVLTGHHKFSASPIPTRVVVKSYNPYQSCEFFVKVIDKEPPTVTNCPAADISITINSNIAPITWQEPVFKDNIGLKKTLQNLQNGKVLGEQVYYVDYAAYDAFNNMASCRFFVHVKGW